jgi:predicted SAM-dependent methyltransferase
VADCFASKLGLHCSYEHFEGDADVRFARSLRRVLRPGGRVCIVPLYLYDTYAIQTDPQVSAPAGVRFEEDAVLYLDSSWQNRHGRFYDARHLAARVRDQLGDLTMTIYRIENAREIDASCYAEFAALIEKPG